MIRVLLADDQALVRAGFRVLIETAPDIEAAGEAANGEAALALAREVRPDVILMDIRMRTSACPCSTASRRPVASRPSPTSPAAGS
jgi:DNA-binding NarL/FixJ family response regulator